VRRLLNGNDDGARAVTAGSGRIVAAGDAEPGGSEDFALVRYLG
jgi:hypothetical protein